MDEMLAIRAEIEEWRKKAEGREAHMDRGGRFLPDHFRPCSDGLFLQLFGDVAFLPHLILDNEGAGKE